MSDSDSRCYLGLHDVFVALETRRLCKFVSLVMVWSGEQYKSGAFQVQSSSAYSSSTDEGFPETLCIEQGVVLSFRFVERKVRRAPRVLRMAVVSQSSVKFGKKHVLLVGATNFMTITAEVATSKFVLLLHCFSCRHSCQCSHGSPFHANFG